MAVKRTDIGLQFLAYLVVGGLSTVVDLGGFALLRRLGLVVMLAAPTSFLAGTAFNYFASYVIAFRRGRYGRSEEVGRLLAVVLVGLALNTGFVVLFTRFGMDPFWAKTLAVPCVLAWNFLGRRWLVFHKELPDLTWEGTKRIGVADDQEPTE